MQALVNNALDPSKLDTAVASSEDAAALAARHILAHGNHTGRELRCLPGLPEHPNRWPRRAIPSRWWVWKVVASFPLPRKPDLTLSTPELPAREWEGATRPPLFMAEDQALLPEQESQDKILRKYVIHYY